MANQCNVVVLEEVSLGNPVDWRLCLQWCRYVYSNEDPQLGYRFIWRWPSSGKLQGARGQARIPSIEVMSRLIAMAVDAGWGHKVADDSDRLLDATA